MSASLSPPPTSPSAVPRQLATPQATTAAILGASSNGWSPLRLHKRLEDNPAASSSQSRSNLDEDEAQHPSSQSPKRQTQNFASLRSHGLVSNSIFLQHTANGSPSASQDHGLLAAVHVPSPSGGTRTSVGLGIGVSPSASKIPVSRRVGPSPRKLSREQVPTPGSDAENQTPPSDVFGPLATAPSRERMNSPRKSKGFEVLQRSSYVSNSPFKQIENRGEDCPGFVGSPLRGSGSAKEAYADRRSDNGSGSEIMEQGHETPSTPSSRGLLVSNRLHGPRTMEGSPVRLSPAHGNAPARQRQRRKTVTFDEILDVQEFDKESSFDVESMRSDASFDVEGGGLVDDGSDPMWLADSHADEDSLSEMEDELRNRQGGKLQIVNGSPDPSTPDLLNSSYANDGDRDHEHDNDIAPELSCDSRETSSVDEEPASPPPQQHLLPSPHRTGHTSGDASFDKTFATAGTNVSVDGSIDERDFNSSFSGLCAADRVDSLVDELLNEEILNSPTQRTGSLLGHDADGAAQLPLEASPVEKIVALPAVRSMQATIHEASPMSTAAEAPPSQPQETSLAAPGGDNRLGLPQLPLWSPITLNEGSLGGLSPMQPPSTPVMDAEPPMPSPSRRNGSVRGRPHISRDAILQRVAREKAQQSQSQTERDPHPADAAPPSLQQPSAAPLAASAGRAPRGSEPGVRPQRSFEASLDEFPARAAPLHPRLSVPSARKAPAAAEPPMPIVATEARPQPPPSSVKSLHNVESPLEKLGAAYVTAADVASGMGAVAAEHGVAQTNRLLSPPTHGDNELSGPSSGRLSPSTLGAPPPPITPAQQAEQIILRRRSKNGKGRRKRSMSTGDAGPVFTAAVRSPLMSPDQLQEEELSEESTVDSEPTELPTRQSISADLAKSKVMLDVSLQRAIDAGFSANLEDEISRIYKQGEHTYKINDRGVFKGVDDKVSHTTTAGDVDSGKAWRKLRRPSDLNEYAREMREHRQNENPKRASGKVFVMVDSFTPANLPVPSRPTYFHCILDNGLHMVQTATVPLRPSATPSKIAQEFELIQHKNLEFSLTLVVKRDAHLQEPQRPSSPGGIGSRREQGSPTLKAFSRFFTSPKKQAAKRLQQEREEAAELAAQASRAEPMLSYINREGAFGRASVVFDKVAASCHGKCLVLELPVYGVSNPVQSMSGPSSLAGRGDTLPSPFAADFSRNLGKVRGTLRLKLFYLPAMPSIPRDKLPENIGECIRGMQNAVWHRSAPWQEGTLTQMGGDCLSWRRRPVKAQGQFLVCYNEVTKKPTVKIDLSKAVSVEAAADGGKSTSSRILAEGSTTDGRASRLTLRSVSLEEDPDANYEVERSFRITFADGERIHFFADTDDEKLRWVDVLSNVIESPIPPNPLWAQMALESISQSNQLSSNIPRLAGSQGRKSNNLLREGRKAPPAAVAEEPVEATTPKVEAAVPRERAIKLKASREMLAASQASGGGGATRSTPSKLPLPQQTQSLGPMRATPSKLPLPTDFQAAQQQSRAGAPPPPVPQKGPAMSVPRPVVRNPAGNVAFDRLRRAAASRSESHGHN